MRTVSISNDNRARSRRQSSRPSLRMLADHLFVISRRKMHSQLHQGIRHHDAPCLALPAAQWPAPLSTFLLLASIETTNTAHAFLTPRPPTLSCRRRSKVRRRRAPRKCRHSPDSLVAACLAMKRAQVRPGNADGAGLARLRGDAHATTLAKGPVFDMADSHDSATLSLRPSAPPKPLLATPATLSPWSIMLVTQRSIARTRRTISAGMPQSDGTSSVIENLGTKQAQRAARVGTRCSHVRRCDRRVDRNGSLEHDALTRRRPTTVVDVS